MTVEPGDYDLRELRRMADEEDPPLDVPGESGEEAFRTGQREELMKLQTQFMSSGRLPEKPYLESLPTRYGAEVVAFEWLDFLVEKAGFANTDAALDYYTSVDWLGPEAYEDLRSYMRGFSEVDRFDGEEPDDLDTNDHVLSLVYVARLASLA
jgi:flagellar protein FlaE